MSFRATFLAWSLAVLVSLGWTAPAAADPNQGPGGPILVVTSPSSTFGKFYAEMLRTEGLNAFAVADVSTVTAGSLGSYDTVILGKQTLTAAQVTMFTNWVTNGGNLIAMAPDANLAPLLGLTSTGTTLAEGYVLVNTTTPVGYGIVGETMQYHGVANRFTLNGATTLATLYSNAITATTNPAVTVVNVGASGGQAAMFAYDLATSVVYTRQGNPAWAGTNRDISAPIRSNDMFFGNSASDPQPDYVDKTKIQIPQADEQQRLFANLITNMTLDRKPLPRFWYFPNGYKAAVVMTGDDHGTYFGGAGGATVSRFEQFLNASPAGCSLDNWECVRGTSYVFSSSTMTSAQALTYSNLGFEVGAHIRTGISPAEDCLNFTPASLETTYTTQLAEWNTKFPGIPAPVTQRHHCIIWSDWATAAKTEFAHGMRLDTNYYYWPDFWVANVPGHMTGSAMPMRFADTNGTLIDVFQAVSQLTDESGQSYPFTITTLLDRAVGPQEQYGAYTVNAHTDVAFSQASETSIAAAQARGVPVVSAAQMLKWLDGRNNSSFGSMSWNSNVLTFTVVQGANTTGLRGMLPLRSTNALLTTLTRGGSPVTFTTQVVKGIEYAAFPATAGNYVATYVVDTTPPTITARNPAAGATNAPTLGNIEITFNEPMTAATINSSTVELRDPSNALVSATVSYDAPNNKAIIAPAAALAVSSNYSVIVKGGASDPRVKDGAGNALAANSSWSFTTWASPQCNPCTLFDASAAPALGSQADPNGVELGLKIRTDADGFIVGIRFYKGEQNLGTHTATLWSAGGTPIATATFQNETATGWQQANFAAPVPVTANTTYVASYYAPLGGYAVTYDFFATSSADRLLLHSPVDGAFGGNGVYAYGPSSSFPSETYRSSNYWVDVVFQGSAIADTTSPTVTSTLPASSATNVFVTARPSVTFSEAMTPATIGTNTVTLTNGATAVPATVTYDATSRTATIVPSSLLAYATTYTVTVSGGGADPRVKDTAGNALSANYIFSFTTSPVPTFSGSIWQDTAVPGVPSENESVAVELGLKFRSDVAGQVMGVRFYKGAGNIGPHVGNLWTAAGANLGTVTFQNETASGWQTAMFTTPVTIAANTTYVVSYFAPAGHYGFDLNYFTTSGIDVGPLHALSNAAASGNGVYLYAPTGGFPTQNHEASNYWVDLVFATNAADATAPTVLIASPTTSPTLSTTTNTVSIGGSAADNFGVTQVTWSNDRGGSGTATGTTAWTVSGITLQVGVNVITVTARDGANNAATDTLTVTYTLPDNTAPTVTITSPTSGATHNTTSTSLTLGGTASDNVAVTQVQWTNSLGGFGGATGTSSWTVSGITLQTGLNTITVTARDAAGNTGTDTLAVTYTPPADTTAPTVQNTSPGTGATSINPSAPITVLFNEAMNASTINSSTVELHQGSASGSLVASNVTFNAASFTATLTPSATLASNTGYTVVVRGGGSDPRVKDASNNALASNYTFAFTTGAAGNPCSANPIAAENCLTGNPESEWDVGAGSSSIVGYATNISVNRGSTVQFKIDTDATSYSIDIYRMGYYGGLGARKITTISPSATLPQIQDPCFVQSTTGLIDCGNWAVSASWAVPANQVSGIYFAKITRTDGGGGANHIFFIVRDDSSTADVVFQTSDTTWQAYNDYGGNSLYVGGPGTNPGRAYKVSYNRPFNTRNVDGGQDWVFNAEYPMVRWLESNGYNVTYISGVDSDRAGSLLLNHKMFLSVGHDEYWSAQQRTNVEAARNAGVSLTFLSGNEVFWKTRWENSIDGSNTAYRTLVSYKETHAAAKIDPTSTWTGTWRDMRFSPPGDARPENSLTGTSFRVNAGTSAISVPEALGKFRLWRSTGVANLGTGQTATFPDGTLGYEWDEAPDDANSPAGMIRLSDTTVNDVLILQDLGSSYGSGSARHALTLYKHTSGALVFGAGTVQWSWGLDSNHDRGGTPTDLNMQQATVNLFADMNVQPGTLRPGLFLASKSTDATAPTSTITAPATGANVPVGPTVTITGTAADSPGGVVAAVQVSVDGGATWRTATGRNTWSYNWTPMSSSTVQIRVRAIDDSGNIQTGGPTVEVIVGTGQTTCPCTIWSEASVPGTVEDPEVASLELGVKFRTDAAGEVTGIRFYKGAGNTGIHVGSLWSETGTRLAQATFQSETASGWQQVNFSAPVAIAANTTYIASYYVPVGHYASDNSYFASAGVDNGPLHALSNAASGGNGVYAITSTPSTFPTQTFQASNYWVDVVFSPTAGGSGDTTAPALTISVPTTAATFATNSTPLIVGGTASDAVGVTQVSWANDRGGSGTATGTTTWSVPSVALQAGANVITVSARDAANNVTTRTLTVTYSAPDTTNPTATITAPTNATTFSTTSAATALGGTASDNVGVTQVTWTNALTGASGTATGTGTWTVASVALTLGSNTITVTARDAAGNVGTDILTVTRTNPPDTTNPTIQITGPTSNSSTTVSGNTINLSGTASDAVGVTQVTWSSTRGNSGTATGTGPWTASGITVLNGSQTITVTARDAANNSSTDTIVVTSTAPVDNTNPTVQITSPTSSTTTNVTTSTVNLGGTANDNVGVTQVTWTNNRGGSGTATGTTTWTAAGVTLLPGPNTLTVTARDLTGRTSTDTLTVTYVAPTAGLVAAYAFNEGAGATVADASGNNNLGTATSTTWTTSGRFGNALTFNGSSSRVFVNNSTSINLTAGMTLMGWVYPTASVSGNRTIIRRETNGYWLYAGRTGSTMRPGGGVRISSSNQTVDTNSTLPLNTWSHVALTYDGSAVRLLVNGVEVDSNSATGNITSGTTPLWIGGVSSSGGENFQGRIDEVRVYNRALTATEVEAIRAIAIP